ncbi:glycosyltransferase family 2 protein [Rubrolithibacter danxiaensis]|uniref:glycosyltransferase family 2 protein n=1 Tax=Rubrolithibacter danxiaensis TaxID=3390805 RepID=UPI003BF8D714
MKISIVTVARNAEDFIESCIASILNQSYHDIEYIIIDGASTDHTVDIIQKYRQNIHHFISEKDNGIYDAMNKGIELASGEVIGILNADDFFPDAEIVSKIAAKFLSGNADVVYGDLLYTDRADTDKITRKWKSKNYSQGLFQWGWMPAHPTFYARRTLFEKFGNYKLNYGSAADYELMIRFIHKHHAKTAYLPEVIVKMRSGGVSNQSLKNRLKASKADLSAMKANGIVFPLLAAFLKPVRKIPQFLGL